MKRFVGPMAMVVLAMTVCCGANAGIFSDASVDGIPLKPEYGDTSITPLDKEAAKLVLDYWKVTKSGQDYYIYSFTSKRDNTLAQKTIFEFRNVQVRFVRNEISEPDKLNGLEWSGTIKLCFDAYRSYSSEYNKWSEWMAGGFDAGVGKSKGKWSMNDTLSIGPEWVDIYKQIQPSDLPPENGTQGTGTTSSTPQSPVQVQGVTTPQSPVHYDVQANNKYAVACYNRMAYGKAWPLFQEGAIHGDTESLVYLGLMSQYGRGITKDESKAVEYFAKAAEQGNSHGQNALAWMYATSANKKYQNGKLAVKYGLNAVAQNDKQWNYHGTLAAAYARNGQFDKAIVEEERAIELQRELIEKAPNAAAADTMKASEQRLTLYKEGKSYTQGDEPKPGEKEKAGVGN